MISIIVAIDEKRGIGKGNDLLFRIPEDFKRMQSITIGHPIIMGRITFESIGRVLPKRTNIIVTRDKEAFISSHPELVEGSFIVVNSLEKAIERAKKELRTTNYELPTNEDEIFIFGGGMLFKDAIENGIVDRLYLTLVKGDFHADIFFPEYENQFPKVIFEETKTEGEYTYTFQNREK